MYYGKLYKKYDKKQSMKQKKKFLLEAQKEYENLYNFSSEF